MREAGHSEEAYRAEGVMGGEPLRTQGKETYAPGEESAVKAQVAGEQFRMSIFRADETGTTVMEEQVVMDDTEVQAAESQRPLVQEEKLEGEKEGPVIPRRDSRMCDKAIDQRPREKVLHDKSAANLSVCDLLAILLNTGTLEISVLRLAEELYAEAGNDLERLGRFSLDDFKRVKGIGDAKAVTLMAALELGRRRKVAEADQRRQVVSPGSFYKMVSPLVMDKQVEELWAMYMDQKNRELGLERLTIGSATGAYVDVQAIVRAALGYHAQSVIVAHNHPSGDPTPSASDIEQTKRLHKALKLVDIRLLDHIVIGRFGKGYSSIADMLTAEDLE